MFDERAIEDALGAGGVLRGAMEAFRRVEAMVDGFNRSVLVRFFGCYYASSKFNFHWM